MAGTGVVEGSSTVWPWNRRSAPRAASLADANPHHLGRLATAGQRAAAARRLRAGVLLQTLFSDELVIADAHALDNLAVRSLLSPDEAVPHCPADLAELVAARRLVIARRDTASSFVALRADQHRRGVVDVPDVGYAEQLDRMTADRDRPWSVADVGAAFTAAARAELEAEYERATGDADRAVLTAAIAWVDAHSPVRYNDFRATFLAGVADPFHHAWLDQLIGKVYTLALPSALGLTTVGRPEADSPLHHAVLGAAGRPGHRWSGHDRRSDDGGPDHHGPDHHGADADAAGDQTDGPTEDLTGPRDTVPATALCAPVLARLPAWIVRDAARLPARQKLLREQARRSPDVQRIRELTFEVVLALDAAATRYLVGRGQGDVLAEYAERQPRVSVRASHRVGTPSGPGGTEVALSVLAHDGSGAVLTRLVQVGLDTYEAWRDVRDESRLRQASERQRHRLRQTRAPAPAGQLLQVEASPGRLRTL